MTEKELRINIELKDPSGKPVMGSIIIRDGVALSTFSDKDLAEKLYDRKNKNQTYLKDKNVLIEKYPHLIKSQILNLIKKELGMAGGKVK